MPLYVRDYLADTGHLSTLEHGAYLLLIMHYWQHGSLPKSEKKRAAACRVSEQKWKTIKNEISQFFDADWRHKRIDAELKKANEIMVKRRAAGKKSASSRRKKRSTHVPTHVEHVFTQQHTHKDSPDTSVPYVPREAERVGKNGTASVCRVTYSEAERRALAFEFDGLDVDQAIDELDRWCDRKHINDPIDRKSAIYGGLRKRHGKARLAEDMASCELAPVSSQLAASRLVKKTHSADKRRQRRRYGKPNGRYPGTS
jgi:uncharacterized protein YdaU (DUF1376 family)